MSEGGWVVGGGMRGLWLWGGGGAGVSEFFYNESKFKKKNLGGGRKSCGGGGPRVSDFFFTKDPNLKKK